MPISRRNFLLAGAPAPALSSCAANLAPHSDVPTADLAGRPGVCASSHVTLRSGRPDPPVWLSGCSSPRGADTDAHSRVHPVQPQLRFAELDKRQARSGVQARRALAVLWGRLSPAAVRHCRGDGEGHRVVRLGKRLRIETAAGGPYLWQWGNNPGYRAFAMVSVASKGGFILLTNSEHGLPLAAVLARTTIPAEHGVFRFHMLG